MNNKTVKAKYITLLVTFVIALTVSAVRSHNATERTILLAERDMLEENLHQKTDEYVAILQSHAKDDGDSTVAREEYDTALDMVEKWNETWIDLRGQKSTIWGFLYPENYSWDDYMYTYYYETKVSAMKDQLLLDSIEKALEANENIILEKAQTYTIYLDGVKVDNDKVYIKLYNYYIDDEKQIIYMTHEVE